MDASSNSLPPEDLSKRGVARCQEKEHARVNAKLLLPWNCRPRAMYLCRDLEDTCNSYL
jgi:hypothetical protein